MIKHLNGSSCCRRVFSQFSLGKVLVVGISFFCFSCGQKATDDNGQISGTDDVGRVIHLHHPAKRIILLTGSPTDALFAMGAGDRIVGITDSYGSSYPSTVRNFPSIASLPGVGTRSAPNVEAILALNPDLVLVSGSGDNPEKNAVALKNAGLPYAIMKSFSNLEDGCMQMERLGVFCGKAMQARIAASELRSEIQAKKAEVTICTAYKPRVYYWWGSGNGTYGKNTAMSELIASAGGINIADSAGKDFFDLSPEFIVKSNPDVIVFTYWREQDRDSRILELRKKPGFDRLTAVRENRVYAIDGHAIHSAMMFPDALDSLSLWIHPELFGNKPVVQKTSLTNKTTLIDDCARSVLVSKDPKKIVALATADVEILFALGAGERLCGVPDDIKFPPNAISLNKTGGMYGRFSAEKIVGRKPDLVLMTMSSWAQYRKNLDVLENYGITVLGILYPRTFYETIAQIRRIGVIVDKAELARQLADSLVLRKNMVLDKTLPLDSAQRPRVYMEWISGEGGRGSTCGNADRDHQIITLAGGRNIFSDSPKSSFVPSDEEVLARNPQIIIVTVDTAKFTSDKIREAVRKRSGWQNTEAVKKDRIYVVDAPLTWANPRMIIGIETIAAIVHPELFK
jgi:iron complex transport system substrate-binding protein